ncbi:putative DNA-binding transcriptional regulator YafY [Nocardia kruczakiae]|uniref:DNA-binding transcriptional regulator YafY n=1 Tax=Nocardia kruczakiae TaxID=261477 RepID=A0ABU1XNT1_9NOCA|nr:WYL domain-containing protein [Nocardia kruczakiae]MDR7172198.1 putative DNA-binding transcriptional regulator YafY [Nocardia kruczakiae]
MPETTPARLLRLLSLLQTHRDWTGTELAQRLDVTTRTVRRDVERLRELGYPVHGVMGPEGGYRLGAGASLPPLLLDDDEAVAVTIGLQTNTTGNVAGIEETSLRALTKMQQVLPARLRHRVDALRGAVIAMPPRYDPGPAVDADQLTAISAAIRAAETLRFDYRSHAGEHTRRTVEPHRIAHWSHRWYLVGWDSDRADWRTYRVDRMSLRTPNGPRFTHRPSPDGDVVAYLRRTMGFAMWPYRSVMRVHVPAERLAGRIEGLVTPIDEHTCRLEMGSDSYALVALAVGMLDVEFEVESPPELVEQLRALAGRFTRAAGG